MSAEILILAALWAAWCALHSAMISETGTALARKYLGGMFKYYRLAYNIIAVVTLAPVLWYYRSLDAAIVTVWPFPWTLLQGVGVVAGLVFLYAGSRVYNQAHFFGIQQIREGTQAGNATQADNAPTPTIKTDGILGVVRHPYYTGGILLLLVIGDGSPAVSVTQIILIAYLYIGTFLEERKLIHEHGDAYRRYMERVPRFFPKLFPRK